MQSNNKKTKFCPFYGSNCLEKESCVFWEGECLILTFIKCFIKKYKKVE